MVNISTGRSAFRPVTAPASTTETETRELTAQIETALTTMQVAVDRKTAASIPLKATEELARDIRMLRYKKGQQSIGLQFFKRLEALEMAISIAHIEADVKTIVKPPLMGDVIELTKRAETYSAGHVKMGLIRLNNLLVMRQIRGDGHCLFRSVLATILEKLLALPNSVKDAKLKKLQRTCETFKKASLDESFAFFKTTVDQAAASHRSFNDIVCDEVTSDKLVAFLREIVCEHNRHVKNDVLDSFVAVTGKSKDEYLEEMMSMTKAAYGDQPEVFALSALFDLNISIVDVAAYGKNTDPDKKDQAFCKIHAHEGMIELFLLYRPNHYDLGILKNLHARGPAPARGTRHFIELAKQKGWIAAQSSR